MIVIVPSVRVIADVSAAVWVGQAVTPVVVEDEAQTTVPLSSSLV